MNDKDVIIAQLMERIKMLEQQIQQLREENDRLKKDSGNSSKPPSSDIVKPPKVTRKPVKKRKRGGQKGHKKFTRPTFEPDQVDEIVEYEFKGQDAQGLEPLAAWTTLQQIVLPEQMFKVIEHRGRRYRDPATGRMYEAPLPPEIRKGGLLGADMTALIAFLKGACHMSYTTIQRFFKEICGLELSTGMLCKAAQKVSPAMEPAYEQLAGQLPKEKQIGVDETGHHDNGKLHWTWCFDTDTYTLFKIDPSRSSAVLIEMLGDDYAGVIGADYYGAYRKYARLFDVPMQYCMAHLIREVRFLAEHSVKKLARWGKALLAWLKKLFETLHRRQDLTPPGFLRSMNKLKDGFLGRMRRPPDHPLAAKLAKRFKGKAAEDYFRFIEAALVEPTNNGTERQIRTVVIDRKVTQGTRGQAGMRWCERIWTVIATCKKQQRNVFDFIHQSIIAHWSNQDYPMLIG